MILNERIHRLLILAEELHFRRAAQRLHLSQPALSDNLKSLESELGARLFIRTSRNVELTEAGNILVSEARRLLKESERTILLVRECESDVIGPVRVGYPAALNLKWLGALISVARKSGLHHADFQFVACDASDLKAALDERSLDGAFFAGNLHRCDQSTFQYVSLFRENIQAVVGVEHRLGRAASVTITELRDEPVVWLRRDADPLLHDTFTALCSSLNYRPKIVQETKSLYECLHFAREGVGITFLPSFMSPAASGVAFLGLAGALHVQYTLVYRRNIVKDQQLDRFVRFVRDYAAERKLTSP
jgi:DNA-binding transcriptional LysR family regulator